MIKYEYTLRDCENCDVSVVDLIPGELYQSSIYEGITATKTPMVVITSFEASTNTILSVKRINETCALVPAGLNKQLLIFKGVFYSFEYCTFEAVFIDVVTNKVLYFIDVLYQFISDSSENQEILDLFCENKFGQKGQTQEEEIEYQKLIDNSILNNLKFSSRIIRISKIKVQVQ